VPLHEIQERWIDKFERPRLRALSALKRRAENDMNDVNDVNATDDMNGRPTFVYVTFIESTPERVWEALTDAEQSGRYWGHSNVSDWARGSQWEHQRIDGSGIADVVGVVEDATPPTRLVTTWSAPDGPPPHGPSRVTFDIQADG